MYKNLTLPGARVGARVELDFEKMLEPEPGLKFDRLCNLEYGDISGSGRDILLKFSRNIPRMNLH